MLRFDKRRCLLAKFFAIIFCAFVFSVSFASSGFAVTVAYDCGTGTALGTLPADNAGTLYTTRTYADLCTKSGYTFVGWAGRKGEMLDAGAIYDTSLWGNSSTLTAQWVPYQFGISTTQLPNNEPFDITFALTAAAVSVDWGDGTSTRRENLISKTPVSFAHKYVSGGIYNINIVSERPEEYPEDSPVISFRDPQKIAGTDGSLYSLFPDNINITPPSFYSTFSGATNLTKIGDGLFTGFGTSVKGMFRETFAGCTSLTSIPNDLFSTINTASKGLFDSTFDGCTNLAGYIPKNTFSGLISAGSPTDANMWTNTFHGTNLDTTCPLGTTQFLTGYERDWDNIKSCVGNKISVTLDEVFSTVTTHVSPTTIYLKFDDDWYTDQSLFTTFNALTTVPEAPGYTFTGFYTGANTKIINADGTKVLNAPTNVLTANGSLYAHYTPNDYTVTFDKNNENATAGTASVTATYDAAMPTPITLPTLVGYVFAGYYDTSATSGGTKYYNADGTSAHVWDKTSDTTLYARWTKCPAGNYCPGDNTQNACPDAATHVRTTYPDSYYNPTLYTVTMGTTTGLSTITSCWVKYTFNNARGRFSMDKTYYSSTTQTYSRSPTAIYYTKVNAGYYGTTKFYEDSACNAATTGTKYQLYKDAQPCPAGSYCPGYTSNPLCSVGGYGDTRGLNSCPVAYPNSATNNSSQDNCYLTLTAGQYVATAGGGTSNCAANNYSDATTNIYYGGTATSEHPTTSTCTACSTLGGGLYTKSAAGSGSTGCYIATTAGNYIAANTDTAQTTCPAYKYCVSRTIYWPNISDGTNAPQDCPATNATTEFTDYPADWYNPTRTSFIRYSETGLKAITACRAHYTFSNDRGTLRWWAAKYNSTTGKYQTDGSMWYQKFNPGYYGDTRFYNTSTCNSSNSTNRQYYKYALECPAGSYCPGLNLVPLCNVGTYETTIAKYDCPTAYPNSASGTTTQDNCYLTLTAGNHVATAGAGTATCAAGGYCAGGVDIYYGGTHSSSHMTTGGRTACAAGTYNADTGSTTSSACTACASGTYQDQTGQTSCTSCTGATYSSGTGNTSCSACPYGYTVNTTSGKTSATQCQATCAAGTWNGEYTQLDYIESSGTQRIDTGIMSGGIGLKTEISMQLTSSTTSEKAIIGRGASSGYEVYFINGTTIGAWHASGGQKATVSTNYTTGTTYTIKTEMTNDGITHDVNGTVGTYSGTMDSFDDAEVRLFTHGTSGSLSISARVYYAKIWKSGSLVRDFVPARRNSDSAIGMYDLISGTFFENAGTGTFTGGNDTTNGIGVCTNVGSGHYSAGGTVNFGTLLSQGDCPVEYPNSAAGTSTQDDCYLTLTAGNYVATAGAGAVACTAGNYCTGGTDIYYGGANNTTTGGSQSCPTNWTSATSAGAQTSCYRNITLNKNGGSGTLVAANLTNVVGGTAGTSNDTVRCYYDTTCALPNSSVLTQTGYIFSGWGVDSACNDMDTLSFTSTAANITMYACKTPQTSSVSLKRNYSSGDTNIITTVVATYDAAMPLFDASQRRLDIPTRDGYTWNGYYDAISGGTQYYSPDSREQTIQSAHTWDKTGEQNLYAQWSANLYTSEYDCGKGASGKPPIELHGIAYDSQYTMPYQWNCSYPGKIFVGWKNDSTNEIVQPGETIRWQYTSDQTWTAQWIDSEFGVYIASHTGESNSRFFEFKLSANGTFAVDCGTSSDNVTGVLSGNGVSGNIITHSNVSEATYTCTYGDAIGSGKNGTNVSFARIAADDNDLTPYNTHDVAAITFDTTNETNKMIESVNGSLGAMFPVSAGSLMTTGSYPVFIGTFKGCTHLSSVPAQLFNGIAKLGPKMFKDTFEDCANLQSIPAGLFSSISGYGASYAFEGTFMNSGLTYIPDGLFSGITTAAGAMFKGTFYDCARLSGYIPKRTFVGLINNNHPVASDMWADTFYLTNLDTTCPTGTIRYVTGYEGSTAGTTWNGYVSCEAGAECVSGTYLPADSVTCSTCTIGNYCPGGSFPQSNTIQGQTSCSSATFGDYRSSSAGSETINDCYLILTPGQYVATEGAGAVTCAAGGYCSGGKNIYYGGHSLEHPTTGGRAACATGTYNADTGSTTSSACTSCAAGTYQDQTGQTSCSSCPAAYPNSESGTSTQDNCYLTLTAGKYVATAGAGASDCAANSYSDATTNIYYGGTATEQHPTTSTCSACSTLGGGLYATSAGGTGSTGCYLTTTAGKYIAANTDTAQTTCPAGKYCVSRTIYWPNISDGTNAPENCPASSATTQMTSWPSDWADTEFANPTFVSMVLTNDTGRSAITQCRSDYTLSNERGTFRYYRVYYNSTTGKYDSSGSYTSKWWQGFTPGYYGNERLYDGITNCSSTDSDHRMYYKHALPCPAGSYCPGLTLVPICNTGTYNGTIGLNACPTDYTSVAGDNDAQTKCYLSVAGGNVRSGTSGTTLTQCTAGTYKATHNEYYGTQYSCDACTGATYSTSAGATSCTACPTATVYASQVTSYMYYTENGVHDQKIGCRAVFAENDATGDYNLSCAVGSDDDYGVSGSGSSRYCMAGQVTSCAAGRYAPYDNPNVNVKWAPTLAAITGNVCVPVETGYYSASGSLSETQCPENYRDGTNDGSDEITDCYLTTTAGNYVATANAAQTTCPANSYCTGGTNVNYGSTGGNVTCSSGTNNKYPNSAAGTTTVNDCYLTTTTGNFVETPGNGVIRCYTDDSYVDRVRGRYCPGGTTVYYGGTHSSSHKTYGGSNSLPAWDCPLGASAATQCYRSVRLNPNEMSGTLSLPNNSGCKDLINDQEGSYTVQVYYNTACNLPTNILSGSDNTGTTYTGTGSWGENATDGANDLVTSITTTSTSNKMPALYAGRKYSCVGGRYLPADTVSCDVCDTGSYCTGVTQVYYDERNSQGIAACPNGYGNSSTGAKVDTNCYAEIALNKNGYSGTLTAGTGTGCSVAETVTGTTNGTLQVYYNTACTLPTTTLTQTGYTSTNGWSTSNTINATAVTTIAASTTAPTITTYYARKPGCAENYYKNNSTTCSTCSSLGANGFYDTSVAGSTTDSSVCYGTTTAGNYVATEGAGETSCVAGNYCPGGTDIYYGGANNTTTGGMTTCPSGSFCAAGASSATECPTAYPNSASGTSDQNNCYLTLTAGNYVATAGAGAVTCAAGGYCSSTSNIYYGGTSTSQHPTTGGRTACAAGKYNANTGSTASSACTSCAAGTYQDQTGQTSCNECPVPSTHKADISSIPAEYYATAITTANFNMSSGATSLSSCRVINWLSGPRGHLYAYFVYNPMTEKYDIAINNAYGWSDVNAGYYLTTKGSCTDYAAYYKEVLECPAGKYCPGKARQPSCTSATHADTFGIGDGTTENVTAGYFASGGATTATPTSSDCVGNNTCGQCTTDSTTGRPTYTDAAGGASSCSVCPAVTGTLASRARGLYSYYSSISGKSTIHNNGINGCYAHFNPISNDITVSTICFYNTTDNGYGGTNSHCQTFMPTACPAGQGSIIQDQPEWVGTATPAYATYNGLTTMDGRICGACAAGTYSDANDTSCTACANGTYQNQTGQTSCTACPGLDTNYEYVSGTGWTEYGNCQEQNRPGNCYSGYLTKTASSASTWGTATNNLTAKAGYKVSGTGNSATCSACGDASYSANGATSCTACPAADSGWTAHTTSTTSTAYNACYESQTPTHCASGSVKRTASSASAYGETISVKDALSSSAGYYVDGTSCTICANGTYYGGGTATSCTACPDPATHQRTTFNTTTYTKNGKTLNITYYGTPNVSNQISSSTVGNRSSIEQCIVNETIQTERGTIYEADRYNSTTQQYDTINDLHGWISAESGYYLTGKDSDLTAGCATYAYYTNVEPCPAGSYCPGLTATQNSNPRCDSDPTTYWTDNKGLNSCPVAYPNTESTMSGAITQCQIQCNGGSYVATVNGTCTNVGAGYYAAASTVNYGSVGTRNACPVGLTTSGSGTGADESDDCGRILRVGDHEIYLRSAKKTTPSLHVDIDQDGTPDYYGNMILKTGGADGHLHMGYDNKTYIVCDESGNSCTGI